MSTVLAEGSMLLQHRLRVCLDPGGRLACLHARDRGFRNSVHSDCGVGVGQWRWGGRLESGMPFTSKVIIPDRALLIRVTLPSQSLLGQRTFTVGACLLANSIGR